MTIISFIAIHSETSTLYIVERFSWLYSQYFSWSSLFELEPCLLIVFWHSYCFLVCLLSWLSPTVLQDKAGTDAAGTWCAHVTPTWDLCALSPTPTLRLYHLHTKTHLTHPLWLLGLDHYMENFWPLMLYCNNCGLRMSLLCWISFHYFLGDFIFWSHDNHLTFFFPGYINLWFCYKKIQWLAKEVFMEET